MKKWFVTVFSCLLLLNLVPTENLYAAESKEKVVSVTSYGADGTDQKTDTAAIQAALREVGAAGGGTVIVPKGKYYIDNYLLISSNTTLHLNDGAIITRSKDFTTIVDGAGLKKYQPMVKNYSGSDSQMKGKGYSYSNNITIEGGTWDGNVTGKMSDKLGDIFQIYCANGITIQNTTVKNVCGYHHMNFASVKDVKVSQVTFSNFVKYKGTDYSTLETGKDNNNKFNSSASLTSEALQFDNFYGDYISQNIEVTGCTFQDVLSGVGNHHDKAGGGVTKVGAQNVKITNNKFVNVENTCINLYSFENVEVSGNTAENVRTFTRVYSGKDCTIDKNTVTTYKGKNKYNMFRVSDGAVLTISNNTVKGSGNIAVKLDSKSKATVKNNTFSGTMDVAIYVNQSTATVTGNTIGKTKDVAIRVADSTATTTVAKNTIKNSGSNGIYLTNSKVKVESNKVSNTASHGIYMKGGSGSIKKNNVNKTKVGNGIYVVEKAKISELSGNKVTSSSDSGIYINGATATISGDNTVKKPGASKIAMKDSKIYASAGNVKMTVGDGKATVIGVISTKSDSVTIPAEVKIGDATYKVTTIGKGTFKGNKTLKSAEIGKNVNKIEKSAFEGCKSLKNVTVKTTKLKKSNVEGKAFKNIATTCKFKVPKKKASEYKKIFCNAGASGKIKVEELK